MHIKSQLVTQLKTLGLAPGDIVMLHASMRAVGPVLGGPDQMHQAILEATAPGGTLMMYAGCQETFEALGRKPLTQAEETLIKEHSPAFDPATARADRAYGTLVEFFRSWPGTVCSANPGARMAANGARAQWLVADHPLQYGYGLGSPLAKLYEHHGKVLLLGSDLDQVTLLHYAEHIAPIANKRLEHYHVPLLVNGQRVWHDIEEFDTSEGCLIWPDRFFADIVQRYAKKYSVAPGKVGDATCYLLDAKTLVDFSIPMMVEEAKKQV